LFPSFFLTLFVFLFFVHFHTIAPISTNSVRKAMVL
jgi:hypothetical protein